MTTLHACPKLATGQDFELDEAWRPRLLMWLRPNANTRPVADIVQRGRMN